MMRLRPLLLLLFLLFVGLCQAPPRTPAASQSRSESPAPVPHRKPSKAKSDGKAQPIQASPTPEAKLNERHARTVRMLAGFLILIPLYFPPWIVAVSRRHRNRTAIAVANLFLGWTFVGWVAALIWASTADVEPKRQTATK